MVDGIPLTNVDYERYFPAVETARDEFAGDLTVRVGLELGVQTHTAERYERLLERWGDKLDFAILSIHQVGDLEFWDGSFQEGRTQQEYNEAYYRELLAVVERFHGYSVLGHLDLIKRYDPAGIYPFERTRDIVAAILERAIADGKGIEVNTSSFRYGLPDLQPATEILELYRDLGGTIVTIAATRTSPTIWGATSATCSAASPAWASRRSAPSRARSRASTSSSADSLPTRAGAPRPRPPA